MNDRAISPSAIVEWANNPSKVSDDSFWPFCKTNNANATSTLVMKTDRVIFICKSSAKATPKRAECDTVSPK